MAIIKYPRVRAVNVLFDDGSVKNNHVERKSFIYTYSEHKNKAVRGNAQFSSVITTQKHKTYIY